LNFESCAHCVVFLTLPLQDKAFVTYITSAELGAADPQWLDEGIYMHAPLPPARCTHTYIYSVYLTGEGGGVSSTYTPYEGACARGNYESGGL